jgi:hypothetical protein
MNSDSPKENQEAGELDPVHSGSPKESHRDAVDFGRLDSYSDPKMLPAEEQAEATRRRLKALRDAALRVQK